ncbi:MAG: glutamine amidotransferase [Saprospiraceae bacterium]|jgi:glutamine amidotransferase|tara:strand:- start:129 stop:710 length:582 start_codon:yes stop_codon:yes gene_type:complete
MIAIIDYNAGNVQSVIFALKRLGVEAVLTKDMDMIRQADKVIFPGVGEASTTMKYLQELGLDKLIPTLTQPVLGICLGLQLLCEYSEEGHTKCLGIFPQKVVKFEPKLKVPHVGWNTIFDLKNGIFNPALENEYVYFVHSFYAELSEFTAATTDYIVPFSAALQKDNFYATQFHVEKSGSVGERILKNFIKMS